jgi:hypothetical protein
MEEAKEEETKEITVENAFHSSDAVPRGQLQSRIPSTPRLRTGPGVRGVEQFVYVQIECDLSNIFKHLPSVYYPVYLLESVSATTKNIHDSCSWKRSHMSQESVTCSVFCRRSCAEETWSTSASEWIQEMPSVSLSERQNKNPSVSFDTL